MRCHWSDSWLFVWKTKLHKDETQSTKKEVLFENIFVYRNNVRLWYIWIIFSSPRVSLCLFFPHVFPFVSFFTTCFHLSLFSPGVCLCLFFHQVFVFVSFFALCLPLCFWFTIFFYHILTSNAFHVTHGCNARVLSPRRSL